MSKLMQYYSQELVANNVRQLYTDQMGQWKEQPERSLWSQKGMTEFQVPTVTLIAFTRIMEY